MATGKGLESVQGLMWQSQRSSASWGGLEREKKIVLLRYEVVEGKKYKRRK